jgi:hypothetical protein
MQVSERAVTIRRLALISLAGQLAWFAFVAFGGLWEPGYSEIRDAVSYLGARNAAEPWVFDAIVAIWGAAFIATAAALYLDAPRGLRGKLGPALIGITGLAQILDGFPFPADCRRTIDAGCHSRELAGEVSWQHLAHSWTYVLGAGALMLSVFAMAWRFRGDSRWGRADVFALGAGLIAIVVYGGLFFVLRHDADGQYYGLAQRLSLAAAGIWVGALTLGLLDLYGRRRFLGSVRKTTSQSGEETP